MVVDNERSSSSVCDCSCRCHVNDVDKKRVSVHLLGSTHNSVDLYVSTPSETKWIFKEEMKNERTRAD
jgi:hypothetical protein